MLAPWFILLLSLLSRVEHKGILTFFPVTGIVHLPDDELHLIGPLRINSPGAIFRHDNGEHCQGARVQEEELDDIHPRGYCGSVRPWDCYGFVK